MLHPQLETFLIVVESGSFSRAAARRSCSAVSIMNQINNLEDRIGVKLLKRTSHGISLTEAGKSFYQETTSLKNAADKIIAGARRLSLGGLPVINLGNSFLRPCKPLIDKLQHCPKKWNESFRIRIVTFSDEEREFSGLREKLGNGVDCFVSPYDSIDWINNFSIHHLGFYRCCISLPLSHRLAVKTELCWDDMAGETLMLVPPGISPVIDQIRQEIEKNHPDIRLLDAPGYYEVETFNACQQNGFLMETPEIWSGVHPGIATIPVNWPYKLPYGLIYPKHPSAIFESFIKMLRDADSQTQPLV